MGLSVLTLSKTWSLRTPVKEDQKKCYRCGLGGHFACDQNCPARFKTCTKCPLKGHFVSICKTSKRKQEQKSETKKKSERGGVNCLKSDTECEEDEYAFTVEFKKSGTIDLQVGGAVIKSVLSDSGSSRNIVDHKTWEELKSKSIKCKSEKSIQKLYPYGFETVVSVAGKEITAEFIVICNEHRPILGRKTATELQVLRLGLHVYVVSTQDIVDKYQACFEGVAIGKLNEGGD